MDKEVKEMEEIAKMEQYLAKQQARKNKKKKKTKTKKGDTSLNINTI